MELSLLVINVILTGILAVSIFGILVLGAIFGKPNDKGNSKDGNDKAN